MNLTFSYIASDTGSGFSCMHGDSECKGDMQQLCVQKNYGGARVRVLWGWPARLAPSSCATHAVNELVDFLTCQDQSQQLIPYNVDQCASSANVDAQAVKDCAAGEEGQALMRDSVAATTAAGVRVCCTVHVNNRPFCVHNGDWEQCGACGDDKAQCLIDTVCSLASTKPAVCASLLADA